MKPRGSGKTLSQEIISRDVESQKKLIRNNILLIRGKSLSDDWGRTLTSHIIHLTSETIFI